MQKPVGSIVNITYDTPWPIKDGDYLQSHTGRTYEVLEWRNQKGIHEPERKRIKALVIDAAEMKRPGLVHTLQWYTPSARSKRD